MRIMIDANVLTRSRKTGVDYYAEGLVWAAARSMPGAEFILVSFGVRCIALPADLKNVSHRRVWWLPAKMYGLQRHYLRFTPFDLLAPVRADVMLFPDFGCPRTLQRAPKLAIVHDFTYKIQPEHVPAAHVRFLDATVRQATKEATALIVNSQNTKQDLRKFYNYDEHSISVIPSAVDAEFYCPVNTEEIKRVKRKYGIDGDYVLFLSTLEPRKNVQGLIGAYRALPRTLQDRYRLVLAGGKGWLDEGITEAITSLGERVVVTGRVEYGDKPALYSGAAAFAYPSFYEGFGMPVLEAMACGTPVITSTTSSMPEVAGDAAITVDPGDIHALAAELRNVLSDPVMSRELTKRGFKQVKHFTWHSSGEKLAKLITRLVKN